MDAERIGAEEWNELQRNLEMSIPAYDRINRFATLGQVSKWRRMVQDRLPAKGRILEVGCGPGSFAEEVVGRDLVCLDPIPEMLRSAESRVNPKRTARGDSAVEFVEATERTCHSTTTHSMRSAPCSRLETGTTSVPACPKRSESSNRVGLS